MRTSAPYAGGHGHRAAWSRADHAARSAVAAPLPYRAPRWLPGGHAQTIYASRLRGPRPPLRREQVATPDGDFWEIDWLDAPASAPLVILFHGLEGSAGSHYARALLHALRARGWGGLVAHFRGCGGTPNRTPRAYHSGDHAEIDALLAAVRARAGGARPLYAVGVSLGGSALLNWLGRMEHRALDALAGAAAVSAPLDLTAAGIAIGQGFNRVYTRHFLASLKPKSLAMAARFPGTLDPARIRAARTLWQFDDVVTAPLHGFQGADDYWRRASSKPWLRGVRVPTLVLNARNDPFIPARSLATRAEAGDAVVLEQPREGGHAGFPCGPFPGHVGWLPGRLLHFFEQRG
jgi:predicted alpha/beta-fold hydrolase